MRPRVRAHREARQSDCRLLDGNSAQSEGRRHICEPGSVWERKGDGEKAIADYTRAVYLDAKDTSAYCARARVYANRSRPESDNTDKAIADYSRAVELDPKMALAYQGRAPLQKERQLRQSVFRF